MASSSGGNPTTSTSTTSTPANTAAMNQATNIPSKDHFQQISAIFKLHGTDNYTEWTLLAKCQLQLYRVEHLIDSSIPHPLPYEPNYDNWHFYTTAVRNWLLTHLDSKLIKELSVQRTPFNYADQLWDLINQVVNGQGMTQSHHTWRRAVYTTRAEFGSMEQFIIALRDNVTICNRGELPVSYASAILILLQNTAEELPNWTELREYELAKTKLADLTETDFFNMCNDAIEKARRTASQFSAPQTTDKPQFSDTFKRRNAKPKNKSALEWTNELRAFSPPSENGECTYCRIRGHGRLTCFYLNIDHRPQGWTPRKKDLWCYKPNLQGAAINTTPPSAPNPNPNPPTEIPPFDFMGMATQFDFTGMSATLPKQKSFSKSWIYDTGSSTHLCADLNDFIKYFTYKPHETPYTYVTSSGQVVKAHGTGTARIDLKLDQNHTNPIFVDAVYMPDIPYSLFGALKAKREQGFVYDMRNNRLLDKSNKPSGLMFEHNELPFLDTTHNILMFAPQLSATELNAIKLHRRLAHCGPDRFINTLKYNSPVNHNTNIINSPHNISCESCHIAKSKRLVSHAPTPIPHDVLDLFYVDVQPIKPQGYGGYNYYLIIVNAKHKVLFTKCLHNKGDASEALIQFNQWIKNQTNSYPRTWRLDGGREFTKFARFANAHGINTEVTAPRTPEPNGPSERYAAYINQTSRAMMIDAQLPPHLWPFATVTAVYIINRMPRPGNTKSPTTLWREDLGLPNPHVTLSHIRIWGSRAYKHIPKEDRTHSDKMGPRALVGHLVGYEGDSGHLYLFWDPATDKVHRSRDVIIDEEAHYVPFTSPNDQPSESSDIGIPQMLPKFTFTPSDDHQIIPTVTDTNTTPYVSGRVRTITPDEQVRYPSQPAIEPPNTDTSTQPIQEPLEESMSPAPDIATRRISPRENKGKAPQRYGDDTEPTMPGQFSAMEQPPIYSYNIHIPQTYHEAVTSPQAHHWNNAMEDQVAKLEDPNRPTWALIDPPQHSVNVLPGKWVYDVKTDLNHIIKQFRARWVICGNHQIQGVDYEMTHSPVATDAGIRLIYTLINLWHYPCEQVDFTTAYLNSKIQNQELYARQPTGFKRSSKICLLLRALYGLKQSGLLWNTDINKALLSLSFTPLQGDPCIYFRPIDHQFEFLLLHVDDTIIAAPTLLKLNAIKTSLSKQYSLKELGAPTLFLGIHITEHSFSQLSYINLILHENSLTNLKYTPIPMNSSYKLDNNTTPIDSLSYQHTTGQLNWVSIKTRPDIAYAISTLQRKNANPNITDKHALTQLFRYLQYHPYKLPIATQPSQKTPIIYTDAAHQDHPDGKSTESFIAMFAGTPLLWGTHKQSFVAPSTTIAEFVALDRATKEALWLRKLFIDLNLLNINDSITIITDSVNAIRLATGHTKYNKTTKWLDNRYFFVRDMFQRNLISFEYVDSSHNLADGLTKPLDAPHFARFTQLLGLA